MERQMKKKKKIEGKNNKEQKVFFISQDYLSSYRI